MQTAMTMPKAAVRVPIVNRRISCRAVNAGGEECAYSFLHGCAAALILMAKTTLTARVLCPLLWPFQLAYAQWVLMQL